MMKVYKSDLPGKYSDYLELEWAYLRIFLILASYIYIFREPTHVP